MGQGTFRVLASRDLDELFDVFDFGGHFSWVFLVTLSGAEGRIERQEGERGREVRKREWTITAAAAAAR